MYNLPIINVVEFLIVFPFIMAVIVGFMKKANHARSAVVTGGGFIIMAASVYVAVKALLNGNSGYQFLAETEGADIVIMCGEAFLLCLVIYLSIKYKKYYCILLSAAGTLPIQWMDLSGNGIAGQMHIRVDAMTALMYLIVGVVGILICIYACGYMKDYHHHHTDVQNRSSYFLAMLFVFIGAMFGLISSDNLSWIFFFWEITSVVSFLLIGYTRTQEAVDNSFRALWMNLMGGAAFAGGILFCTFGLGICNLSQLTAMDSKSVPLVLAPVTLFAFAALVKSAQMPFSRWLLGAMVAPTPSSALLHSATMVKVGVYMLLRLSPLMFGNITGVMVTVIGGFTFFAASLLAISQSDGKKVLAYSTISNLGLITACAGVGQPEAVWAGLMLMMFHAVSKSLLFQTVGDIENCMGSRDIEDMHGLIIKLPRLAFVMIIGICGMFMAPFGMLVAKWAALKSFVDTDSIWLVLFLVYGSGSTLFYWAKWLGKMCTVIHQSNKIKDITHKSEYISIIPLTSMIVIMCFAFPWMSNHMIDPVLAQTFVNMQIANVIGGSDVVIMLIMLAMLFIVPIGSRILAIGKKDKMTMGYSAGVNTGDDRHFYDSFGQPRAIYMANWYMQDYFGEKKLLWPSIWLAAAIIVMMLILGIGGAI